MARPHRDLIKFAGAFQVVARVAVLLGFTNIAAGAVEIAKVLFFILILLCVAPLFVGRIGRM